MEKEKNGRTLGELQKEIKELKGCIATQDANTAKLLLEIDYWKRSAAGLKGWNKQLQERVEHYKKLDLEGDELNGKRIAELDEKNKVIEGLQAQVHKLAITNKKLESEAVARQDIICEYESTIRELQKPWWRKIF